MKSETLFNRIVCVDTLLTFDGVIPSLAGLQLRLVQLIETFSKALLAEEGEEAQIDELCQILCCYLDQHISHCLAVHETDWQRYLLDRHFYGYDRATAPLSEQFENLLTSSKGKIFNYAHRLLILIPHGLIDDIKIEKLRIRYAVAPAAKQMLPAVTNVIIIGPWAKKWFPNPQTAEKICWKVAAEKDELAKCLEQLRSSDNAAEIVTFFPILPDGEENEALILSQIARWRFIAQKGEKLPCILGLYARLSQDRADGHTEQSRWTQARGADPEKAFSRLTSILGQQCHQNVHALHRYVMTDMLLCWLWESGIVRSLESLFSTSSLTLDMVLLADYSDGFTRHGAWANWIGDKFHLYPGLSRTLTMPPLPAFQAQPSPVVPVPLPTPLPALTRLPAPPFIPVSSPQAAEKKRPRGCLPLVWLLTVAIVVAGWFLSQHREFRYRREMTAGQEKVPQHQAGSTVTVFTQGSAVLLPENDKALSELLPVVMKGQSRFLIVGHSDNTGSYRLNQTISEKRAEAVRDWLVNHTHLPASRFIIKGEGDTNPVASNDTAEGQRQNRRVELIPLADHHFIETSKGL
ncbi:OmpA family protein [Pantoea sp. MBD-2R]|uniref:OmpA family protein n=1 Tax=Pantoea sp. MBD-2R TaxID=3141540 RepID=UPI003182E2EB